MLSNVQIGFITSLQRKKFRNRHGLFVVEGIKSVREFAASRYRVHSLYATADGWAKLGNLPQKIKPVVVSDSEIRKISALEAPQGVLALVRLPEPEAIDWDSVRSGHCLVLDDVRDPGNLGTIVRTAAWFGIRHIVCSIGTVDAYNPKAVQASMGSLAAMDLRYTDLPSFLDACRMPVYGALLEGTSIYETDFGRTGLIVLGNEGCGIRPEIAERIDHAVTIPRFAETAESLNVAVAAAVFCSEIGRRGI